MQEAVKNLLLVLVTLFPIVDPLGGNPFFLALTREYSAEARKALSWRIAINSFFLLVATYFVGTYVLAFFGISLPVVQVGGGLIVICDWMDAAEAARRRKTGRTANRPTAGHNPPGVLSLDIATDRRPWINLCGDYAGCERGSPSRVPSFDNLGRTHWISVDSD
jgi:hypothetical protein